MNVLPPPPVSSQQITGKRWTGGSGGYTNPFLNLGGMKNVVITKNIAENTGRGLLRGSAGQNVLIVDNDFRNISADIFIFPGTSKSTSYVDYGLKIINNQFSGFKGVAMELKCTGTKVIGNHGSGMAKDLRVRHGMNSWFINNSGFPDIGFRCGPHLAINNPNSVIHDFAGNLPGEKGKWEKLHVPGGGQNMQASFRVSAVGNKGVIVGYTNSSLRGFPALENVVAPGHPNVDIRAGLAKNTRRLPVPMPGLGRVVEELRSQQEEDFELMREHATLDVYMRDLLYQEDETAHWFRECVEISMRDQLEA